MAGISRPVVSGARAGSPGELALRLSATLDVDAPLASYDIRASAVHVGELARLGLVDAAGSDRLIEVLEAIGGEIESGSFEWDEREEDVHMNVEAAVRAAVGEELAGQLQAGRSRNEEVATDERLWLRDAVARLDARLLTVQQTLVRRAAAESGTILPAHTHTQPAQPVLLAHHLLAYVEMLERDRSRLTDLAARADRSPAGSGAVVGSGLALDRDAVASALGFAAPTANSLDAVADRDYAAELVAACAQAAGHASRMCGELVLWSTPYLAFARLPDAFSSGSSMLPNKRNPDAAELVRARAARIDGALVSILTLLRGLPLAYHRDLQETRAPMLESVASLELILEVVDALLAGVHFERDAMRRAATSGHSLATALAERLVAAGVPFRTAHRRVADLVSTADSGGVDLADLPEPELADALPELAGLTPLMPTLEDAVAAADVVGGTAPDRVETAVTDAAARLGVELPA